MTASIAAAAIEYVLVKAKGANILPSCPSSTNTGTKLKVMISNEKNNAGPTSDAAFAITCQRLALVSGVFSMCLWTFSTITIAPSTMAPIAIAIPPSDMMLALMPCHDMMIKAIIIPIGKLTNTTNELRIWNKNKAQTTITTRNSSSNFR